MICLPKLTHFSPKRLNSTFKISAFQIQSKGGGLVFNTPVYDGIHPAYLVSWYSEFPPSMMKSLLLTLYPGILSSPHLWLYPPCFPCILVFWVPPINDDIHPAHLVSWYSEFPPSMMISPCSRRGTSLAMKSSTALPALTNIITFLS